ncbi:cold shock domain-containing protein [[Clostridium] innocuum]|uniref:cold shock domain-containing protein n=1 Tax=Clostridium innocuum TaxID=1522 RepID=UPI000D6DA72F|nr:cold shock domain-containing protein [[Clostridium] innocuum]MCR0316630.1 cold shock domain-containing protein [[Clostridium] innocuum]MCR0371747.1 cold shock domain-containing protein [[Clostridium] innocuum]MCR0376021.1 cold shock domain-containing protein [[Clostridium] innocuum]MCR0561291.1 cold shock domain-containing protein [[Clostridium] innocuum]MCR0604385.1 cold shock domain-containing protein [[Clostridium] innocuum]
MLGTIIKVLNEKGYGFLIDELDTNRFFHFKSVVTQYGGETLKIGDMVSFKEAKNGENDVAVDIFKLMEGKDAFLPGNHKDVMALIEDKDNPYWEKYNRRRNNELHRTCVERPRYNEKQQRNIKFTRKLCTLKELICENCLGIDFESLTCETSDTSLIVSSAMVNLPLPNIILIEKDYKKIILVGESHLCALYKFMINDFAVMDNPFRADLIGKYYNEKENGLAENSRAYFDNIKVSVTILIGDYAEEKCNEIIKYYELLK